MGSMIKPRTKRLINLACILIPLTIVLVMGITDKSLPEASQAVRSMNAKWVVFALGCYFGYLVMDSLAIGFYLFRQGYRLGIRDLLFISLIGQYYSNITPGASGGQPMQIYYLSKKKVPAALATSAIAVRFFCFQVMLSVIGTVVWIRYGGFIAEHTGSARWVFIVGYVYNTVMVCAVAVLALSKNILQRLMNLGIRIGGKFKWIRHPEELERRAEHYVTTFHEGLTYFRSHPMDMAVQLLFGGTQLMFLMSVIAMIYYGLGLSGYRYEHLVTMNICEFLAAAYAPMPGASGAQEGVFGIFFAKIFPESMIFVAILLWRFFTYYISIVLGLVVNTVHGVREGNSLREAAKSSGEMLNQVMEDQKNKQ